MRVLAAVSDLAVSLPGRRNPGGILGWYFFSLFPETTFLAGLPGRRSTDGGFWEGFADGPGTLARWTFVPLDPVASPAVGDSDDKTDIIFEIMSLRWLNSITATIATNSSIRNRYTIRRGRLRLFKLGTGSDAMGPGSAGWGWGGGEFSSILFKAFKIELKCVFLDPEFRCEKIVSAFRDV